MPAGPPLQAYWRALPRGSTRMARTLLPSLTITRCRSASSPSSAPSDALAFLFVLTFLVLLALVLVLVVVRCNEGTEGNTPHLALLLERRKACSIKTQLLHQLVRLPVMIMR